MNQKLLIQWFAPILLLYLFSSAFAGEFDEPGDNSPATFRVINGVTVPADFPEITTEQIGETAPGLIFYATHRLSGVGPYFIITNNEGDIYYYLKSDRDFGNPTVHSNNLLTLFSYYDGYYVFDSTFTIIDTISDYVNSHELLLLENGNRLSFRAGAGIISEFDANDSLIFEYQSVDSLLGGHRPHTNSIDVDYDGHLIVSSRDYNEVVKINRKTGKIMWHLGGAYDSFTYINEELRISWQHDARAVKGYPNHYLIYDNGMERWGDSLSTRVVEYVIDTMNMTAEKVWEFSDPEHFALEMGSAQRFENGNTFIDYPEPNTHALEVDSAGKVVFKMNSTNHRNYRCRRFNWYGKMNHPMLILEDMEDAVKLIFNQFGDSAVNYYKIYYGLDRDNLQLMDSTTKTNYIASNLQNYSTYYFGVSAVNDELNEGKLSEIQEKYVKYRGPMRDIVKNGDFRYTSGWDFDTNSSASAAQSRFNQQYNIFITDPGSMLEDITVSQESILLLSGKTYILEFDAYSSEDRIIEAELRNAASPFTNYSKNGKSYLTTELQHFSYLFTMTESTDPNAVIVFNVGQYMGDVIIDNVSLKYLEEGIDADLSPYANVNFQLPSDFPVSNYKIDTGGIYDESSSFAIIYGWNTANMNRTSRDAAIDIRLKGFNYLKRSSEEYQWEIRVPNTEIAVKMVLGDAESINQINQVYVEDRLIEDPDGEDNFDEIVVSGINITDGKLTIKPGPQAVNAKICYIDIYYMEEEPVSNTFYVLDESLDLSIYPIPASDQVNISFLQNQTGNTQIEIFNILGHHVETITAGIREAGRQEIIFNTSHLTPSVYFLKCTVNGYRLTRKIIIQ